MKNYCGRRVRIQKYKKYEHREIGGIVDTGKEGRLLKIDIHNEHVMIENEDGELVKLFYKLVKLI